LLLRGGVLVGGLLAGGGVLLIFAEISKRPW
jgi:hypothetical protein